MKNLKNLLPLFALVLGFALVFTQSAFKNPAKTGYTFYYAGPDLTVNEVVKESNWIYDSEDNECSAIDDQACSIRILDASLVDLTGTNPVLKNTANLTATLRSPYGTAYVTGSADSNMQKFNEAHP